MVRGKQTCKILKDIRRQIAEANDIEYITSECQYKGDCTGTCPKCESEVRYLEHQLERRRMAGKAITLLGLSAGIITMNACANSPGQSAKNTSEIKLECQSVPADKDSLFLIKGTVTDSLTQKPIVGANVSEKETTNGTLTDANGEFTLKVSGKYPLIIQYVGMETQEIEINKNGATYIQVALRECNMTMGESTIISGEILEACELLLCTQKNTGFQKKYREIAESCQTERKLGIFYQEMLWKLSVLSELYFLFQGNRCIMRNHK